MSYRSLIQSAVRTAFLAAGDIPVSATYIRTTGETYDPNTLTNTKVVSSSTVEVFVTMFSAQEIDNVNILPNDVKLILNAADITFVPLPGDQITVEGKTYDIVRPRRSVTAFVYELQGRSVE